MTTDLVDWLAVEYGDAEGHEDGGARHVDHGLVEEQPLRPPAAGGKQRPALNDGGLSHSGGQTGWHCRRNKRGGGTAMVAFSFGLFQVTHALPWGVLGMTCKRMINGPKCFHNLKLS